MLSALPAEAALEILRGLDDGVIVCGPGGEVRWVNPAVRRMLGLPAGAPAPPQLEDFGLTALAQASIPTALRARPIYSLDDRFVALTQLSLGDADGAGQASALLLRDCTREVVEWRTSTWFTSVLAHELRTPMTVIIGNADLLLRGLVGPIDAEQRVCIDSIRRQAASLTRLIGNVVVIADLNTGAITFDCEPVSLLSCVTEEARLIQGLLKEIGLQLVLELPDDLPEVLADAAQLRMVLRQLLDNACRHTISGGITLRARALPAHVLVELEDTGPGIPAELRERAFERFTRGATRGKGAMGVRGLGLGLAICRELLAGMGGAIWAAEAPGGGALLAFTLPYAAG